MVEQAQRRVKRGPRPRLGCKSCEAAHAALVGIDLRPMLRKGPREDGVGQSLTAAAPCYVLAASSSHRPGPTHLKSSTHENLRQSRPRSPRRCGAQAQEHATAAGGRGGSRGPHGGRTVLRPRRFITPPPGTTHLTSPPHENWRQNPTGCSQAVWLL